MKRLFGRWWVLTGLAVLLLSVLVLFGLPLVIGFMRHWWVRLPLFLLIIGAWILLGMLRRRRAQSANAAIASELATSNPANDEEQLLNERMKTALASLRSSAGSSRHYLYDRPWYVIIGPPGAGKSTALINSGLRFPFSEQKLQGVGGTRNLDFWFADEAVLVDTAGRYTTQDSDASVDASGWKRLLSLLRRHRPLRPINGVIVAIAADELVRSDCAAIDRHAATLRRRLAELKQTLEVSAPVYLVITKADMLAGFTEYFGDLDVEGRRAVLGATLPYTTDAPDSDELVRAFDRMAQSITDRQAKRLYEEPDTQRRSLILGFPAQLGSLRARLMRLIDGTFVGGEVSSGRLRGFYFTSGVQHGAPLDRILSSMGDVYDMPSNSTAPGSSGKAYFLNRLLSEVIFSESGLVQSDPAARARQRLRITAVAASVAGFAILMVLAWLVSFAANRRFQASMLHAAVGARDEVRQSGVDLVQVRDSDADLRQVLPVLDALRNLPRGYQATVTGSPPLTMRFGLYQSGLAATAEQAYREGLRRILLPRILLRLEQLMQGSMNSPMNLYEPFKVYLMLGGQGPLDRKAVRSLVTADWEANQFAGADSAATRNGLATHLDALLEDRDLSSSWRDGRAPLNGELVTSVRTLLQTLSPADRAYAMMKQKAALAGDPWTLGGILTPGNARAFAQPDSVLALKVPYFYTRDGFERFYTVALPTVQHDIMADAWVLRSNAESVRTDMGNIRPGVAGHYAQDYIAAWENVVSSLKPADYFNDQVAYGAFTREPSPLEQVLLEVRRNTSFEGGGAAVARKAIQQKFGNSRLGQAAGDYSAGRDTGLDAGSQISSHFRDLQDYVGDGKTQSPLKDFIAALRDAGKAVLAARSATSGAASDQLQGTMATAMSNVKAAGSTAPAQLHAFVEAAAGGGAQAQVTTVKGAVATSWSQVAQSCRSVADQKYPFYSAAAHDAAMLDAMRLFGPEGTLTTYVDQQLKRLISTDGPQWRWRDNDPVTATMDPASPEEFAKAARIRDLLVSGLAVKIAVEKLGAGTGGVEVSSGNSDQRFDASSPGPRIISWSPQANPEAFVQLYPVPSTTTAAAGSTPNVPAPAAVRIGAEGPWAFFRIMDKAEKQNAGPQTIRATFRSGAYWATLLVQLPSTDNPFGRGGMWSFRCPTSL